MVIRIEGEEYEVPNDITRQELVSILVEGSSIKVKEKQDESDLQQPLEVHVHMPSGNKHVKVNRKGEVIDSLDVTEQ